jgi:hypothetical protein
MRPVGARGLQKRGTPLNPLLGEAESCP